MLLEIKVPLGTMDRMDSPVIKDLLVLRDPRVTLELLEPQVKPVPQVQQGSREPQDQWDSQGQLGLQANQGQQEKMVHRELPVHRERLAALAPMVIPEL